MMTLKVSLPEPLKAYIEELVAEGIYRNPSEYLSDLVDRDRQARRNASVEPLLVEGLDSGPATPMSAEDWEEIEQLGLRLLAERSAKKRS